MTDGHAKARILKLEEATTAYYSNGDDMPSSILHFHSSVLLLHHLPLDVHVGALPLLHARSGNLDGLKPCSLNPVFA